jgi:hypothetical protein
MKTKKNETNKTGTVKTVTTSEEFNALDAFMSMMPGKAFCQYRSNTKKRTQYGKP